MHDSARGPETSPGLVSVIVPVGGVDSWLDEAVESVLSSTGVDFEVIAVFNNGAKVPASWPPLRDARVRVLSFAEALGPAGAAQEAVNVAQGEFIAHLDADDLMSRDRLRVQKAWLIQHPDAVLVSSQVRQIDDAGAVVGAFTLPHGPDVRSALVSLNVAPHSAWMMRAEAVRAAGGYDVSMAQMEDYDLLLRLSVLGPIAVLPDSYTDYRLHASQLSRVVRPDGRYVGVIASRRRALGEAIGMSPLRVGCARIYWELQQWAMYFGRRGRDLLQRAVSGR